MRKSLFLLALFASASILPITAHANTIDDFVLTPTAGGSTITFSLPASPPGNESTCPPNPGSCLPGSETNFDVSTLVTIGNGTPTLDSIIFPTGRFGGGLGIFPTVGLQLMGPQLFLPDAANPTFLLGTFDVSAINPKGDPPFIDYSLTISAEGPATPTPEPSSLVLLITGASGLIGVTAIRRSRNRGRAF
jgi:hypothetical protein